MGKKNKKLNKTVDLQMPPVKEEHLENEDDKLQKSKKNKKSHDSVASSDNNITHSGDMNSLIVSKKKKSKRTLDAQVNVDSKLELAKCEETKAQDDDHNVPNLEVNKKKKKERHLLNEQNPNEATNNFTNDDGPDVPSKKKKKNKNNLLIERPTMHDVVQANNETEKHDLDYKDTNKSKMNGNETQQKKSNDKANVETKEQKTRSQKKKRTGTAVLNDEESQVMDEDIDKFCDELDDEDNNQYEEWVKLIEASLPPPKENNKNHTNNTELKL